MPKIGAPTVAEHHEQRRADLLAAASRLLADGGFPAVTLAAVGSAAGLARSSVYQYFDSAPALVAAVVEDAMTRALDELVSRLTDLSSPLERMDAFVGFALHTATDETHRGLAALAHTPLPEPCAAHLAALHREQRRPLRAALVELGATDPDLLTELVVGVVQAASRAMLDGQPEAEVLHRTLEFLHHGLMAR